MRRYMIILVLLLLIPSIANAQDEPPSLPFDEEISGQFAEGDGMHTYHFDASAGDIIRVFAYSTTDDPRFLDYIALNAPDGEELLRGRPRFGPEASVGWITLQADGRYIVTLVNEEPSEYVLRLDRRETPHIVVPEALSDNLWTHVDQLDYTFTGQAGDAMTLQAWSGDVDLVLDLYGPDGALIASDDDSSGNLDPYIERLTLPEDGDYRVVLRRFDAFGEGNLRLRITPYDEDILRLDTPQTVMIAPSEALQIFDLALNQGDVIALSSDNFDAIDVRVRGGGEVLFSTFEGENAVFWDQAYIPQTGDQSARLSLMVTDMDAEPIDLTITRVAENALEGGPLTVHISPKDPVRTFTFQGYVTPSAVGELTVSDINYHPSSPMRIAMHQREELFLRYEAPAMLGVSGIQTRMSYFMPEHGPVTVTLTYLGDAPTQITLENAIFSGSG